MKKKILLVCALASSLACLKAQSWVATPQKTSEIRREIEVQYSYRMNLTSLRDLLKDAVETGKVAKPVIISLPTAEGKIEKFAVYSDYVMERSIADKFQLGSYIGAGIDDPSKYVRLSTSPTEMQSMIIKDGVFQFIEPITTDKQIYGVFYKAKRSGGIHGFQCSTKEGSLKDIKSLEANGKKNLSNVGITKRPPSTKYRTYKLALSVTGEYTQYFMNLAGVPSTATEDQKKAPALVAMNNTMTRVNGVFEKDFGIKLIIQDLPNIIYTDPSTDPFSNSLNLELQQMLSANVGNGNYDMGHLLNAVSGDSNAGSIGSTCKNPTSSTDLAKGSGFSQKAIPAGDSFDIDVVTHEMGHQLGGYHTFSYNSEGLGANVEPGEGTTIMGYAGISNDQIQPNSDAYFHYKSIDQILTSLESKPSCGISQNITVNTPPIIATLIPYTIPKGTAYFLETTATDVQGDPITFTWEQNDSVDNLATISGDSGWGYNSQGALTRSYFGTTSGRRYFPSLPLVMNGILTNKTIAGNNSNLNWETVSYIPRVLHYAVSVRDQNPNRPMLSSSETTVTVGNEGPFKFNGLTPETVLYNDVSNTIQWEVVNTNNPPYNVSNVKIDYTTDNGTTWTDLIASTPNIGSYIVQMPASLTGSINLRISSLGNIFYAVSPAVTVGTSPTSTTSPPTGVSTIDTEVFKTAARVSWNSVPGASTYSINYRKQGETNWQNTISLTNSVVLSSLEDEMNYEVKVAAVASSVPGSFSTNYTFKTKGLKTGVDYCILNSGASNYGAIEKLSISNINHDDSTHKTYKDLSEDPSKIVNLTKGLSYTFTSKINIASEYSYLPVRPVNLSVWIDYNRNGNFEVSERVSSVSANYPLGNSIIPAQTFTVPGSAYNGNKLLRMRVITKQGIDMLDSACGDLAANNSELGGIIDLPVRITSGALATNDINDSKIPEISIYPNPAETLVTVKNLKRKAEYSIFSADGRLVLYGQTDGNNKINVTSLSKGMYVITLKDDRNTYNTKLIKK